MTKVGNYNIGAEPLKIFQTLSEELHNKGINLINDIFVSGNNIMMTCPYHNEGKEKHASSGFSMDKAIFHCFSCGAVATLPQLINHCFGYDEDSSFGEKWLISHFITYENENGRKLDLFNFNNTKKEIIVKEDLSKFRYDHPYMYKRKLTDSIINKFDIGYDKNTNSITFPVYDLNNNLIFVGRRSINNKHFHYPANVDKPVYGLNECKNENEIIICESVFNALTCYVYGKVGVALLGTGSASQYEILKKFPCRKYILAFDGDEAGRKGRERFIKNVNNKIITYYELPNGKDINDLSKEEFDNLKEKTIYDN